MRTETWIPSQRAIRVDDGQWLSEALLPLPVGGDDWLAAVRGAQRDLKVFEGYPNGHPLGAADHEKIGRYCAADRLFRNHHVEIIHGLLIALASADTHPKGQDREDGLGS